ncbi:MAG: double zinc ribbon domain-containing protein [Oscillospiraceae bacterium]|nr:double zinc ribbon domain-containing protein [Oscillospiraceae bacterium]
MNNLCRFIADIFFPSRCPICLDFIRWDEFICTGCADDLKPFPEEVCPKCGKAECFCDTISYDMAFVCFYYEEKAKSGILSLKDGHKEFGIYTGNLLGEKIADSKIKADAVIPVPMSEKSYKKRRYNQAEVIAERIAEINHLPLLTDLLYKNESAVQHTLTKAERLENTAAFGIKSRLKLDNMKIILCDDVITTGSTMNRCAALLKEMGAAEVYAAAAATTKLKKE